MFHAGVHINPHYNKRYKGGEDAACLNSTMLCVADGVGGWAESGVDPAIYSKRLCMIISSLYESGDDMYIVTPKELLVDSVGKNDEIGSCTCCIVNLDSNSPVLTTANIGDSGYMILRSDVTNNNDAELSIFYESKEQQHQFNFPY